MNIKLLLIHVASFCSMILVFLILAFVLLGGSIILIHSVHGQTQGGDALSNSSANATGTSMSQAKDILITGPSATTNATGYSKYGGSTFSLQYPAGWKLERSDIGDRGAQAISILNGQRPPAFVQVFLAPTGIAAAKNATQEEIESHIEDIFPTFVKEALLGTKNDTLAEFEKPVYDRYTVDGHKVGSVISIHDYSGVLVKTLALGTIVGNNDFVLKYTTTEALFDQTLPIVENIIKSVKFNRIVGFTELNEKDFSLLYPKGWRVEKELLTGAKIPSGSYTIRISGEGDFNKTGALSVNSPNNLQEVGLTQNITQAQIDSSLEQNFPIMIKKFQSGFINEISNTSAPVYNRYVIDGHKAGSAIFTVNYESRIVKFVIIGTVIGNNAFMLSYSAPADIFDRNLPVAEKIIKSIKLTQGAKSNNTNVAALENLNLNGIWKRDDGEQVIITQQGSNVIASPPYGRANCEQAGLIGKEFESEFVFKGHVQNGKVLADNNMCYFRSLNQSENGLFLDKANYTIMNGGTALEGFVQNRFYSEFSTHGRYDKVGEIQPVELNLKTDRVGYEPGQIVHFSGKLSDRLPLTNQTVLFQIFDPIGQGYKSQDVIINPDNSYSYDLNIKNDTRRGTFKVIATYGGFGDTVDFKYGVPSTPIPSFFHPITVNNTNVTTIQGTPTTISLFYNDGELPTASDVEYKVKFDVPNEKFQITEFDKGSFDNVKKISNDTLVFNTARILKNESKTGLVVFTFDNNSIKDRKLVAYSNVTVNGMTENTVIDPGLGGFLEIGTKIVNLAKDAFELGLNFYNQYVPCFNIKEILKNNTNPQKKIEAENCSNHPQKTQLKAMGLPTFIKPHFDPRDFDIDSNRTTTTDLTLEVKNNTLRDKKDFYFNVAGDVVYNVFGHYFRATNATTDLSITLLPKIPIPPTTSIDSVVDSNKSAISNGSNTRSKSITFTFSGSETGKVEAKRFQCRIDNSDFVVCTSPFTLSNLLSDGPHAFKVRAVDSSGNNDNSPELFTWNVDTTPPANNINRAFNANNDTVANGDNTTSTSMTLVFSGNDTGVGLDHFECSIDGASFTNCTSPVQIKSLADGSHTLEVRAQDKAGNKGSSPASFNWTIDTVPPATSITSAINGNRNTLAAGGNTTSTSMTFAFTGNDSGVGLDHFECSIDGASFEVCTNPTQFRNLTNGVHTIEVRAQDKVVNVDASPATFTWTINKILPIHPVILQPKIRDCSSLGKSTDSPELFQFVQPLSTNSSSLPNETALDNLQGNDKYFMQVCVNGYDKISNTRYPIDIVFSIDSSPSMKENDKDNLRISAAKSLIDRLDPKTDKAGFITWGREIALQRSITSDFSTLKANLDGIKLVGGTNLDAGLKGGVELLEENTGILEKYTNAKTNQEQNRTKVIVFLSDGNGHYTRSSEPGSLAGVAQAKGYKIFTVGLNINNASAENDLKDIASATGGVYYPSTVAENLNEIYNKIFQNIITKEYPRDVDLIITMPKDGIKVTGFNIEPSGVIEGNKSLTWKNISQHIGNKDKFLSSDEIVSLTFNIEGLPSNNNPVSTLNYTDTDGINRSIASELEVPAIQKPPLG
jgi:Mg-chelatase subunit ChlD